VGIIGPRQCGKTSLALGIRPDWKYFDLENPQSFDKIRDDLNFFFKQNSDHVIIDEAQLSGDLFKPLRGVIDSDRETNDRFILTGSSSPELLKNVSESLAGRVAIYELSPLKVNELNEVALFSFYECINENLDSKTLDSLNDINSELTTKNVFDQLVYGGYPQPALKFQDLTDYKTWMENYFRTYVERDIRALFPKLDNIKYRQFVNMLTSHSGTIVNRSQFDRSLDVNETTVRNDLEIADGTMIWRNIPSYEKSKIKSLIKMPKGIFRDSGLCNHLQRIHDFEGIHNSSLVGQNYEAFVTEELIRGFQASSNVSLRYYYRTKCGSEVDLILEGDFGVPPIKIKYSSSTRAKQLIGLVSLLKIMDCPLAWL